MTNEQYSAMQYSGRNYKNILCSQAEEPTDLNHLEISHLSEENTKTR